MKRFNLFNWKFVALLLLFVVVALCFSAFIHRWGGTTSPVPDYQPDRMFTVQELQEDFNVLETTLREAHGNLYAHIGPEDFQKTAQNVRQKLDSSMTEIEFLRSLSPLVSAICCGHTHLKPSRGYEAFCGRETRYLPYVFAIFQKRLFIVDEIFPEKNSLRGSEIHSINGRSLQSVMNTILPNLSGDGTIQTQKQKKLGNNFFSYWDRYVEQEEKISLCVRTPDGCVEVIEPDVISRARYRERMSKIVLEEDNLLVEFKIDLTQKTALLRMKTFYTVDLKKKGIRYKSYFQNLFRLIREDGVENMIIDIRGNAGGSMNLGADLLAYLLDEEFKFLNSYQLSPTLSLTHKKHIDQDMFISFKWLVTQKKNGWRSYSWHRLLKPQKPKHRFQFKGNVYVLIDGETFSAASMFAALLRRRKDTFFVGEETGGTACGSGVAPIHLTLPNSRLRVQIPFGYINLAGPKEMDCSRGVIPDFIIGWTSEDILAGTDPALDFVLGMTEPRGT